MQLTEPTLLLDEAIVRRNIERMALKTAKHDLKFKPHFKTHQSHVVGSWFREHGVKSITVSSLKMAKYFADNGWDDITIAFPFYPAMAEGLNRLARKINLSILVSDVQVVEIMRKVLHEEMQIYIEIDTGSMRTGFKSSQVDEIKQTVASITSTDNLSFSGFYSHPGHSYSCRSADEITKLHNDVIQQMQQLKHAFPSAAICIGDTPCCSVGQNFDGIDEISPGNFVFYDLMQHQIGACSISDIGVALACPVISVNNSRKEIVVHGGAIHLSKDTIKSDRQSHFGTVVHLENELRWNDPIEGCFVKSVSQEHGVIQCSQSFISDITIGDVIGILPVHSCLTAQAMKSYTNIETGKQIDHLAQAPLSSCPENSEKGS